MKGPLASIRHGTASKFLRPITGCARHPPSQAVGKIPLSCWHRQHARPYSSSHPSPPSPGRRSLLTLAIETSCDDTCVAILERSGPAARLLFNKKVTSDNRAFGGVNPLVAIMSHTTSLANLVREALPSLPQWVESADDGAQGTPRMHGSDVLHVPNPTSGAPERRRKPDFVTVTRGPGIASALAAGLNTAKGLAVAWGVPLLGAHHMQAHALTPRLVNALEQPWAPSEAISSSSSSSSATSPSPQFPFLTLLVSGGHTQLVLSTSLTAHAMLAEADSIAVGDMIDKGARAILPAAAKSSAADVMYGALLERFAFPDAAAAGYEYTPPATRADELVPFDSGLGWTLQVPLPQRSSMAFNFTSLNGEILRVAEARPAMPDDERRVLARAAMRLAFEHVASRVVFALADLKKKERQQQQQRQAGETAAAAAVKTLVVSGGVASNRFLMHLLRSVLDVRGFADVEILAPPPALCTDNAAMIAWTGTEMWEAGWRSNMEILVQAKWPMDSPHPDGGILGLGGWEKRDGCA